MEKDSDLSDHPPSADETMEKNSDSSDHPPSADETMEKNSDLSDHPPSADEGDEPQGSAIKSPSSDDESETESTSSEDESVMPSAAASGMGQIRTSVALLHRHNPKTFLNIAFPPVPLQDMKVPGIDPAELLMSAEGGYNDFLPQWAFPKVQVKAVVNFKDQQGKAKTDRVAIQDTIDALSASMVKAVLSQFHHLTLSKIYHYAQLGEFTTILFREKKLVDILVHVLDKTYYAHRHVLCCHSEFFSTLLVSHSLPPDQITDVTLNNIHPLYFQDFLHFSYYGEIDLNEQNIPPLLNLCNKLHANLMRARIHMFIAANGELHPKLIKKILTSKQCADRPLAIIEAIDKFEVLMDDSQFLGRLNFEDLVEILSSDSLRIKSELDVFWAAIFWVAYDVIDRLASLGQLMNTVRTTCMSTLELMDISRATSLIRLCQSCKQIIMNATWVCHAREMGLQDPLRLPVQKPRKLLIGQPPYQPSSKEFDMRYHQYLGLIGNQDIDTIGKSALAKGRKGGVVFADEKGIDLEYVYVSEQRSEEGRAKKKKMREAEMPSRDSLSSDEKTAEELLKLWQGEQSKDHVPLATVLTPTPAPTPKSAREHGGPRRRRQRDFLKKIGNKFRRSINDPTELTAEPTEPTEPTEPNSSPSVDTGEETKGRKRLNKKQSIL